MKLSEIKQTLAENNLQLTKSLGQNFLHDGNQLRRIVRAAELQKLLRHSLRLYRGQTNVAHRRPRRGGPVGRAI